MAGKKITLNGVERGLQFGSGAIEIYCDTMECDIEGLDYVFVECKQQIKAIPTLVLAGLINYAELNNESTEGLTHRQVQFWIDEAPQEEFNAVMEEFKKSKYFGKTIESHLAGAIEAVVGGVKKKSRLGK